MLLTVKEAEELENVRDMGESAALKQAIKRQPTTSSTWRLYRKVL
jgi:hypothetical protein